MFFYPQRFATIFNIFCFGVREIRGKNFDLTLWDSFTFSDRCRLRRSAVAMQRISALFDDPKRMTDFIFQMLLPAHDQINLAWGWTKGKIYLPSVPCRKKLFCGSCLFFDLASQRP